MKNQNVLTIVLLSIGVPIAAESAEPVNPPAVISVPAPPPAPTPAVSLVLPAMNYVSSVASDELRAIVKESAVFAKLDKELYGSPITLRVTHTLQLTSAGKATGLLSAVVTGSTLGLIPAVTNNSLVVTYEILVHDQPLTSFSYQRGLTRVVNIWATDPTYGLGKEGLEWLKGTAREFTAAAANDAKLAELQREYEFYFATR